MMQEPHKLPFGWPLYIPTHAITPWGKLPARLAPSRASWITRRDKVGSALRMPRPLATDGLTPLFLGQLVILATTEALAGR